MKKCRTVSGLISTIEKGENACLIVWDIMGNNLVKEGAYLNLGKGKYAYVGKEWPKIRNYLVNEKAIPCKDISKYQKYYR